MDRPNVVQHLRRGKPVRFDLTDLSWVEAHEWMDDLEQRVGLRLERREVIDTEGSAIIVWIRGFGHAPIERQYQGVGHGTPGGTAAD